MATIQFLCGLDGETMQLTEGKYSLFYRCPCYYKENREEEQPVCNNSLSLKDAQKIQKEIEEKLEEGELKEDEWGEIPGVIYRVCEIYDGLITVFVVQKKYYDEEES